MEHVSIRLDKEQVEKMEDMGVNRSAFIRSLLDEKLD
jgi:Arc/MetJ-type ribon-helix-helix transcriptional regulator